jgi:glycosyltransferase involved in cell wall biosynthesis
MRIAFYTTMSGLPWGGSEELWSHAALALLAAGHEVAFNSPKWPRTPAPLQRLVDAGATPYFRRRKGLGRTVRRKLENLHLIPLQGAPWLVQTRPDLVVISSSCHTDDPQIANACRKLGIRYTMLLQAASAYNWIAPRWLDDTQAAYAHAARNFFVSTENREIVESNLAWDLSEAEIVDNPFNVRLDAVPAWPASQPVWKLACVARLHFISKSQDILLRVLRMPKWRARPLHVALWGSDHGSLAHVQRLIELYGLQNQISYAGYAADVETLWSQHHGLILPSRVEGNALALIEAMVCGRMPIATNVGRASELIDDGESGFIAPAATVELIDAALERAWQRRHDWQVMGQRAARAIRQRHSLEPGVDFARRILAHAAPAPSARRHAA